VNGKTLFEIGSEMAALDALLDEVAGDVSDPAVDAAVTQWQAELAADEARKLDGYVNYLKQIEMEAAASRAEAEEYLARAKTREARAAFLKSRMVAHLFATGRTSAKTATGRTVAVQANGGKLPVLIDPGVDVDAVDPRFVATRREIDRDMVRESLEAGDVLPFARLGSKGSHLRVR
jgi:hypothetical protein